MLVRSGSRSQTGFTLIEVLVALLVLLVGLLGVVGMQYLSLQQVNNANLRSQVNLHALVPVRVGHGFGFFLHESTSEMGMRET